MDDSLIYTFGFLLALAVLLPAWGMRYLYLRRLRMEAVQHRQTLSRIEAVAADAMFAIDERGRVCSFNLAAEQLFGYDGNEIIGRSVGQIVPAAAGIESHYGVNALNSIRRTPNGIGGEVMGLRKDGTSIPLDLRLTDTKVHNRRLFHAVARDLTDRYAADRNARDVTFLDGLLNSVGAPVLVVTSEGKVARHNRAFEEWSGHGDPEGRHYWELMLGTDEWTRARVSIAEVIASGTSDKGPQVWRKRNGETLPVYLAITALRAGNNQPEHAVILGFELPQGQDQASPAMTTEAVERLAGGIAQQFNDLLTSINGYSELVLHSMEQDDPLRRDVQEIQKAGERAAALTSQLLAFSRKQPMKTSVFNLNGLISGMKQMLELLLGERIQVSTILDLELGNLKADSNWIEQVILNLAVNARDAMPEGGKLTIETANMSMDASTARKTANVAAGEYVVLSVSDTGVGMDPAATKHVFEPFYTTKRAGKGMGLGLSTVYGVVRQSGGNVVMQSIPGSGTCVRIYLPRFAETDIPEKVAKGLFLVRAAGH